VFVARRVAVVEREVVVIFLGFGLLLPLGGWVVPLGLAVRTNREEALPLPVSEIAGVVKALLAAQFGMAVVAG
jgi:hypothetical protein